MTARIAPGRTPPGYGEILLVLGVSLGKSAVYATLSIINKLTRPEALNRQTTSINNSVVPDRPLLDLAYQVAGIVFPMVPAFLALYLLALTYRRGSRAIGFDLRRPVRDLVAAVTLAVVIGVGGIVVYVVSTQLGINTVVRPANLAAHWWTIPAYLGLSWMNGFLEEIVVVGYLATRLREKAWPWWLVIGVSAVLRGTYHLYQGFGGFVGNLIMGAIFAGYYARTKRVLPLVVAHFLIDAVIFVGYPLAAGWLTFLPQ